MQFKLFNDKNLRWKVAILLCLASALSYIDRNTLAILAPTIQKELNWSDVDYANITALFVLSYTIMYAISGRIIDRIGTRRGLAWSVGTWSLVSTLHALANSIGQFSVARLFLGATESGNFPAGVKAISEWFPMKERALAIGIFTSGSSIGAAFAVPIVSFVSLIWGWRMAFVVTGLLGFIWLVAWLRFYYLPEKHSKITEDEKKLILEESKYGDIDQTDSKPVSILKLLKKKESWGCFSARIFIDPVVYFLIFWIPKYLQDVHGFTLSEIGMTAWLPYAAMGIGTILGGWLPKFLIERKNWSLNKSRKTIMFLASIAIPVFCFFLSVKVSPVAAILLISAIMMAHGLWSNITLPTEIYPKNVQATITGIGGTLGGIMSVITQKLIGISVGNHSYLPIFMFVGLAYITTFLLVQLLIGKLGTIRNI
jgi:ACS family hexuronate transporter-like MFS transporter